MSECPLIVAAVVEAPAKRHMQRDEVEEIDRETDILLHFLDVFVSQDLGLDIGEAPPRFATLRIFIYDVSKCRDRVIGSPRETEAVTVHYPVARLSTWIRNYPFMRSDRFLRAA